MRLLILTVPAILASCATPDSAYRRAEQHYINCDFESAQREALLAVRLDPNHSAAWALLLEIEFLLNRKPDPGNHDPPHGVQVLQELHEIYQRSLRAYNLSDCEAAERELRKMDAYMIWMVSTPDLEVLCDEVRRLRTRLRDPKGQPKQR